MSEDLKKIAREFGFSDVGFCDLDLSVAGDLLNQWLAKGYQGEMSYMSRHGDMRYKPEKLYPKAKSVFIIRMDYLCPEPKFDVLNQTEVGFVSRYAQHRDYHKLIRARLVKFAKKLESFFGSFDYRVAADSAPIMEKPLAVKAGLGWIGKNTNLINTKNGSYFFLGCLITSVPLLEIQKVFRTFEDKNILQNSHVAHTHSHCGSCTQCLTICPTKAIVAPYVLDARRCISYLTIEYHGKIPEVFRKVIGNRIYGCDDCQIVCPWNKFSKVTKEIGFESLRGLKAPKLLDLFIWKEAEFLKKTEGSAIRRIGYLTWQRNVALAMGNLDKNNIEASGKALVLLKSRLAELIEENNFEKNEVLIDQIEWSMAQLSEHFGR